MNTKPNKDQYINQIVKALDNSSKLIGDLIRNQIVIIDDIRSANNNSLNSQNVSYEQKAFHYDNYCSKANSLIQHIPIDIIRNDFSQSLLNYPFYTLQPSDVMNIGKRLNPPNTSYSLDEWCNVINESKPEVNIFSIHKSFNLTHYSIRNANSTRVFEIYFNESFARNEISKSSQSQLQSLSSNNESSIIEPSCSIHYLYYSNEVTHRYKITKLNPTELTIQYTSENKSNNELITKHKRVLKIGLTYKTESEYNRTIGDYKETKQIHKTINNNNEGESYGKKTYTNSCNRKYYEDWKRNNFNTGYELKVHSFLDDGYGTKITKDFGNRLDNNIESYNYCDTSTENISSGDTTLTKQGRDLMNEWNCYTTENKANKTELTENKAKNFKDGLEWYEKWVKSPEENYAKKWGKSAYEEWEEDWTETTMENGDIMKKCNKKCKKLLEDKEWEESWTEKNGDRIEDSEKTCYKMNKSGNEKYEHYWGSIKVNYLDNKRMNYDGFIINDTEKKEFKEYY